MATSISTFYEPVILISKHSRHGLDLFQHIRYWNQIVIVRDVVSEHYCMIHSHFNARVHNTEREINAKAFFLSTATVC